MVAVSDEFGGIYNGRGLDPQTVHRHIHEAGTLTGCIDSDSIANEDLLELEVDILIPAAIENQITSRNAAGIKARIVAELANGPTTPRADRILFDGGIYVIPDFLCNAGGVTVSYFEMVQNAYQYHWDEAMVNERLDYKMTTAFQAVNEMAKSKGTDNRVAAYLVAVARVAEAVRLRGWI